MSRRRSCAGHNVPPLQFAYFCDNRAMKKFLIIVVILLFAGCATAPVKTFTPPPDIKARAAAVFEKVDGELKTGVVPLLRNSPEIQAWFDGENMNITLGVFFSYDDDTAAFIMAHELSHAKLNHVRSRRILSGGITATMIAVGVFIPGAGLLNHAINPAAVNNFAKPQELEADKLASETCLKLGIPISKQIEIMNDLRKLSKDGGGFWSQHPSWDDRIQNISR